MKKTLAALTLAVSLPAAALAVADDGGRYRHGPDLDRLSERLALTAEQRDQLQAVFDEHAAARRAMREQMRERLAEVLTPEQREQMEAMRMERREHRHERRHRGRGKRGGCEYDEARFS